MSEDLRKSSSGPPDNLIVPYDEIDLGLWSYGRYLDVKEKPHLVNSEMMSTGEDSMAHVQKQRETGDLEEIQSTMKRIVTIIESSFRDICQMHVLMAEPCQFVPKPLSTEKYGSLSKFWNLPRLSIASNFTSHRGRGFCSTFVRNKFMDVEHLDLPVPLVEKKNGYKWNMTEDEYDLWVSLDEETTDILIQKCPEKAEVVRGLRSEAQKGKAIALPPSSVATGPSTSSPCRANGIQYQTSRGCGGLVDNQKFDPDGPLVCSATPNQTGNVAATFFLEDGNHLFPTDKGKHIVLDYPDQFHSQQVDPAKRSVNSVRPNKTCNEAATFCLESGGGAANDPSHPPLPDQTLLDGDAYQVHKQPVDPVNGSVNLAPPNQTGNFADIEAGADLSIAENNEPPTDKYNLENTFMVGSQMISTMGAVSGNKSNSEMSSNAEKIWYFLLACIFVSLIFWFYALLLFGNKRRSKAARFVMAIAYIATAFALLAVTGLQLPDEVMNWGTLGACVISLPAIIVYAMK